MALVAVIVMLTGCTGDKTPPTETETTGQTGDTGDPAADAPTFTRVRNKVLPSCALAGCHGPTTTTNGFSLVEGEEYEALVGVASASAQGEVYVIPGDAEGSYIVKKVTDAPGIVGDPMPPPFGGLDPRLITVLQEWIDAGALDN